MMGNKKTPLKPKAPSRHLPDASPEVHSLHNNRSNPGLDKSPLPLPTIFPSEEKKENDKNSFIQKWLRNVIQPEVGEQDELIKPDSTSPKTAIIDDTTPTTKTSITPTKTPEAGNKNKVPTKPIEEPKTPAFRRASSKQFITPKTNIKNEEPPSPRLTRGYIARIRRNSELTIPEGKTTLTSYSTKPWR